MNLEDVICHGLTASVFQVRVMGNSSIQKQQNKTKKPSSNYGLLIVACTEFTLSHWIPIKPITLDTYKALSVYKNECLCPHSIGKQKIKSEGLKLTPANQYLADPRSELQSKLGFSSFDSPPSLYLSPFSLFLTSHTHSRKAYLNLEFRRHWKRTHTEHVCRGCLRLHQQLHTLPSKCSSSSLILLLRASWLVTEHGWDC